MRAAKEMMLTSAPFWQDSSCSHLSKDYESMLVALFFLTTAGSSEENKFTNIKYLDVFSNSLSIKEHSS